MGEDLLKICAIAFNKLIDIEYYIILGRKGIRYDVKLIFRPDDFHHLAGLKYLDDVKKVHKNRERVFKDILSDKITYDDIKNSPHFIKMEHKINYLHLLEDLIDNDEVVFNFDKSKKHKCQIEATYLLNNTPIDRELYFFIDKTYLKKEPVYYGRSFFPKEEDDYTVNQTKMTLLKKVKYNKSRQISTVQYISPKFKEEK